MVLCLYNLQKVTQHADWITTYTVPKNDGSRCPYDVNIVDVPSFDSLIPSGTRLDQVRRLFTTNPPQGFDRFHKICLVVKALDENIAQDLVEFYKSIIGLFGGNIDKRVHIIYSSSDGSSPSVHKILQQAGIPSDNITHINNFVVFAKHNATTSTGFQSWNSNQNDLNTFFVSLGAIKARPFDVPAEHTRLETTVKNIEPKLDAGMSKLQQLRTEIDSVEDNKSVITSGGDFEYSVKSVQQVKKPLSPGINTTNCEDCHFTCHESCGYADNEEKKECCAMNSDGYCMRCPSRCYWDKHKNTPYIYQFEEVTEKRKYSALKAKYENIKGKMQTPEQLLSAIEGEFDEMIKVVEEMIMVIIRVECKKIIEDDDDECDDDVIKSVLEQEGVSKWLVQIEKIEGMIQKGKTSQCLTFRERLANVRIDSAVFAADEGVVFKKVLDVFEWH